jgi:hypothetical protein
MGIRSCGTCRARRKALPPGIKGTLNALQKGEMKVWEKGHLQCLAWYDTKPVLFLSTHRQVSGTKNVSQYRGSQGPSSVTKPLVALDYNKHKTHVDTVDQLRQYYAMDRKHYKTWPSLAWWLMDMCIINAYALWYRDSNSSASQRDFRKALTRQVLAAYPPLSAHKRGRASSTADRGMPGHCITRRRRALVSIALRVGQAGKRCIGDASSVRYICALSHACSSGMDGRNRPIRFVCHNPSSMLHHVERAAQSQEVVR